MGIASLHQGRVRSTFNEGYVGTPLASLNPFDVVSALSVMDLVYDTWTLTRSGANATFGPVAYVDPDGVSYSYTYTVTGSTTADDASDAAILFRQEDEITAWYDVTVASNVVTFTARNRGANAAGTFSDTDSNITTAHSVAGADGTDIPAGRLIMHTGKSTQAGSRNTYKAILPSDRAHAGTALAAQAVTDTFAGTIGAGDEIQVRYYVPALNLWTDWVRQEHDADETTTLNALVTKLNTELDAVYGAGYGITAARSGSTITHTADVAGYAFSVETWVVSTASGTLTVTSAATTGAIGDPATDATMSILGISLRDGAQPSADGEDDAVIAPGTALAVARRASPQQAIRVVSTESWAESAQLWVSTTAGATDGRLYSSGASGRLPLPKSMVRAAGYESANVGLVAINL